MNTEEAFQQIASSEVQIEANDVLDKTLARTRKWRDDYRAAQRREPTLHDLIQQMLAEPSPRGPALVGLAAALWRLLEEEA